MIIVKTSNGDIFLNEKDYQHIEHLKKTRRVLAENTNEKYTIVSVESVRYINDAQATDYKDEGSEVSKLKEQVHLTSKIADSYLSISGTFRSLLMDSTDIIEALSETEDPSNGWHNYLKELKKYVEKYYKTLENKIKSDYKEISKLDKALKDVTKDGSV